jgi:succinate dehydrogenase / fumarate reductase cytochrome b subunit
MASQDAAPRIARVPIVRPRPVFLNLVQIQSPVGAVCSFGHRVSGVLLAAGLPLLLWLIDASLGSPEGYAYVMQVFDRLGMRVLLMFWIWALAHHLLAGIRHLLSDVDLGSRIAPARRRAWFVNIAGVVIAAIFAGVLLLS